jgi:hypothetical protein
MIGQEHRKIRSGVIEMLGVRRLRHRGRDFTYQAESSVLAKLRSNARRSPSGRRQLFWGFRLSVRRGDSKGVSCYSNGNLKHNLNYNGDIAEK